MKTIGAALLVGIPATAWTGSVVLAAKDGVVWLLALQLIGTLMVAMAASR